MIQAWWIRRWYFLYISVCMVLHIVALFESFQCRHITFYTNNISFTRHCWYFLYFSDENLKILKFLDENLSG
ncbi:hypothetical protein HanIR_Chr02g0094951 [Helianthus annuus]|nr:hypothetical protein HanIR_Chr02g0094951 [Helianthus annuus]